MKFTQAFRLALKSMAISKMQSFLTMLGIIIGVAAVIILTSIVGGFSNTLTDSFESLGTNLISITLRGRAGNIPIEPEDIFAFCEENKDLISYVSPTVSAQVVAKSGTNNVSTTAYGVSEDYQQIKSYDLSGGRFISYMDTYSRSKVCVIGSYIANELFPGTSPIGKSLKVNGEGHTIVGVLEEKQGGSAGSGDDMIIIPYTAATRLTRNGIITTYSLNARYKETADEALKVVKDYLYSIFENEDLYSVFSMDEALDMINDLTGILSGVLVGIAAISLLVGGIGIMNIMLVSVTERTREIGIRKALGGKRRDILMQFIIEAATTSGLGGVIGIIVGCVFAFIAAKLIGVAAAFSVGSIATAFSVSVFIGITFGYFPAAKAAKLNPIEALRYD